MDEDRGSKRLVRGIEVKDDAIKGIFATRKYSEAYFNKVKSRIQRYINEDGNDQIIETMMDFNHVITKNVKSSVPKWVDAVRFCQLSLNHTAVEAWKRVFPDRYQDVIDKYKTEDEIKKQASLRASTYSQGKLVVEIKSDMLIPTHIMYAGVRQDGVQKQIDLMNGKAAVSYIPKYLKDERGKLILDEYGQRQFLYINDVQQFEEIHQVVSPKIQQEAAKMVIELTTAPESLKIEGTIHHTTDVKVMSQNVEVMDAMRQFAEEQRRAALGGASLDDLQRVAHIINVGENSDTIDVEPEDCE